MKKSRLLVLVSFTVLMTMLLAASMFALVWADIPDVENISEEQPLWMRSEKEARELMASVINRAGAGEMAPGVVITVTTSVPDVNPDTFCSLIEAMENANDDAATHADCPAGSGADIIELSPGTTYTLTAVHITNDGPNGLPLVSSDITINGHGATIARDSAQSTPLFRVLHVSPYGAITLNDLTIRNGYIQGFDGGGIYARLGGLVALVDSTVCENTVEGDSTYGGGIAIYGAYVVKTTLIMSNSQVISNTAPFGGGIVVSNNVLAIVNHSAVSSNTAVGIVDTDAGGIFNGFGSMMTIMDSTISQNTSNGGASNENGNAGGIDNQESDLLLIRSTVSNNQAIGTGDNAGNSGGVHITDGSATIVNSTISGNTASGSGVSSISGNAGGIGIANYYGSADTVLTLINSTVADNHANVSGGGVAIVDFGAGPAVSLVAENSTVAGNSAPLRSSCLNIGGNLTSHGHNLEDGDSCDFDQPTDIVNADPLLGPLQDNGGETETHALLDDSPAIDAGSDATCAAPPVDGEDQRGVARPIGPHCDIGAFESSGSALEADLALMAEASPSEVPVGSTVTYILTATNAGPDTAYGIALTATLPVSVTFVSADGDCLENGGTVVCALGNLDSTDEISVTISARAQAIGPATVSAVVRAVTYDPVMADNSSQATSMLVRGKTFLPYIERKA